jgi:hypothetical protein
MTITRLRKFIPQLTSEQHVAARLAIKGLSHVLIANKMGISASAVGLLIEAAEAVVGEPLPRALGRTSSDPVQEARHRRRAVKKAEMPDIEVAPGVIETCSFCGLRWHSEDWPNVAPWFGAARCDLKIRRLQSAYIGCALGSAW